MSAVYFRELSSYFKSARGYICLGLYVLFGGQFFLMQIRYQGVNDIAAIFSNMYFVVLLTLPVLTMRLLAEEKRTRTDQVLLTAPVSLAEIVWGKYLAAYTVFAMGISVFFPYFAVLGALSSPDVRMFAGNLAGMLLLGAALIAIGLFVSALTESQMLAAVGTFGGILLLIVLDSVSGILPAQLSAVSTVLGALSFSRRFSNFTAGLLGGSDVVFFVSVVLVFQFLSVRVLDRNRWTASRRIRSASLSAAVTVAFLAVVVLFNVVLALLFERLPALDLTDNRWYQLSEESVEAVRALDTEVEIIVCSDQESLRETDYGKQMDELLKEYGRTNERVRVRFADVVREPELAREYADYAVAEGSVIFHSALRTRVVTLGDCVERVALEDGSGYRYVSKTEQVLTSGILYVTEAAVMQVSILTGHQELGCEDIRNYLEENNYEIKEQNIATEEIDPASEMAFLLAPSTDYSAEEMEKLDRYLDHDGQFGRRLVYVAAYNQPELPGLSGFLAEWGIRIGEELIVETDAANAYDDQGFLFGAEFTEAAKPYLETVRNPSLPALGYYCRPVETLWEEKDNRTAETLIQTKESCVLYALSNGAISGVRSAEKRACGIAALGSRLKYQGTTECRSYVAAFGSSAMFSSSDAVSDNFNNRDFTVELINRLNGKEQGISIAGVSLSAEKLSVTQSAYRAIAVVFGLLLPAVCFAAGAIMAVYRRRL